MDWGLVGIYDYMRNEQRLFEVNLSPGMLVVKTRDNVPEERYITGIYRHLQRCMNDLILPAPEMKALGMEYRRPGENGFYDPGYTIVLSAQQKAELKDKLNNVNAKPGVTLRRNYVGLKKDWGKLGAELQEAIVGFFAQHRRDEKLKGNCQICGRPVPKGRFYKMRQNKNPFYNQHHNNRVRGHANTVTTGDMCPTCNLLNIFAAVQSNTPYFIDDSYTHIILPRIDDLTILYKIFYNIKSRLIDLLDSSVLSYSTNIRDLWRRNVYQGLIGVYFSIVHRYLPEEDAYAEDPFINVSEREAVRRWVVLRYSKGQNVSFAHFNHLDIDPRLFELVRGMEYGAKLDKWGNVYTTFLGGISCRESGVLNDLARGIARGNWSRVAQSLLVLIKESRRPGSRVWAGWNALEFFEVFTDYALTEVDKVLEKQLAEDIKVLGRTIGSNFKGDIALFTSLNNAPDVPAFRRVLKDIFLKMYKMGMATKKRNEEQKLLVPGEKRVENILESTTEENIEAVKDTLLIYAVLSALRQRAGEKGEQNESAEVEVQ